MLGTRKPLGVHKMDMGRRLPKHDPALVLDIVKKVSLYAFYKIASHPLRVDIIFRAKHVTTQGGNSAATTRLHTAVDTLLRSVRAT